MPKPAPEPGRPNVEQRIETEPAEVIESIRAMFKNVDQEKAPIDVTKLVRDMLGLMRGELRANDVSVETKLDDNLPDVRGNRVQLQQVILNLIRNAIEAMNSVTNRARLLRIGSVIHEPDGVLVSVKDSGTGLNPEDTERIFDSFFTTKPQGTGMGLSICRSQVGQSQLLLLLGRLPHALRCG